MVPDCAESHKVGLDAGTAGSVTVKASCMSTIIRRNNSPIDFYLDPVVSINQELPVPFFDCQPYVCYIKLCNGKDIVIVIMICLQAGYVTLGSLKLVIVKWSIRFAGSYEFIRFA